MLLLVVGSPIPATQDQMAQLITPGICDRRQSLLGHAQEVVRLGRGADGVHGDRDVAVGAVLESEWEGNTGGQLAVQLRLGRAGADGAPRDQISQELGRDGVEQLTAHRDAHVGQFAEQSAGNAQALVDLEGAVDLWVVDEALPADGRAGLLKVGAHDDEDLSRDLVGDGLEEFCVLDCGAGVVDRARADDDDQAVVLTAQDLGGLLAG